MIETMPIEIAAEARYLASGDIQTYPLKCRHAFDHANRNM